MKKGKRLIIRSFAFELILLEFSYSVPMYSITSVSEVLN